MLHQTDATLHALTLYPVWAAVCAAVFWMDPTKGPTGPVAGSKSTKGITVGQLTVKVGAPTEAILNFGGHSNCPPTIGMKACADYHDHKIHFKLNAH
jgi:hypothetical protein|eukprot:SAG25_NODE_269_length_10643_cov_3.370982_4_plen_97_part_00